MATSAHKRLFDLDRITAFWPRQGIPRSVSAEGLSHTTAFQVDSVTVMVEFMPLGEHMADLVVSERTLKEYLRDAVSRHVEWTCKATEYLTRGGSKLYTSLHIFRPTPWADAFAAPVVPCIVSTGKGIRSRPYQVFQMTACVK
jgi:hypothetical protein